MFDDLKIRTKLVLLVAGPLVIVLALAALGASARLDRADDARRVEDLAAVARADSDVVDALQQESLYATAFVGSDRAEGKDELAKAQANTDTVLAVALEQLQGGGGTSSYRSAKGLAVDAADKLTYIRRAVDQGYRWDQVATTYSTLGQTFLAVNTSIVDALTDPAAGGQLRTAAALADYKEAVAFEGSLLTGVSKAGGFGGSGANAEATATAQLNLLRKAAATEQSRSAVFASIADSTAKGSVRDARASTGSLSFDTTKDLTLAGGPESAPPPSASTATADTGQLLEGLHAVETGMFDTLLTNSSTARTDAEQSSKVFLGAAALAVVGAAAAALLLGRKITRPLERLTSAADHLASDQMPRLVESLKNPGENDTNLQIGNLRPIEISSNDEIGRLATAFNEVQRVAEAVAVEQAALLRKGIGEMFVNLARRNQALLDRQIEFIDELERGEEDPDQLDNLYRLDHLATRMRRNAESLLVLAGAEPPRRRGRPAPLANVVRAALAEVEDFSRIELLSFDEVLVASNAAADVAHLLSELMENATNFSPPETRVEVVGHRTKADGYVISITDHGIGMSADQIVLANESLAKPPLVSLTLSRSLGFIVVGRLAARHRIAVRMMASAAGGVTAVVSLAPALIVDTPGGMAAAPMHAPARLKPVLESSGPRSADAGLPAPVSPLRAIEPFEPAIGEPLVSTPPSSGVAPVAWAPPTATPGTDVTPDPAPVVSNPSTGPSASPLVGRTGSSGLPTRTRSEAPADLPEALTFAPQTGDVTELAPSSKSDGLPPTGRSQPARPFFLEDAEPSRGFGRASAPAPEAEVVVIDEEAKSAPRLFGGPVPSAVPARPEPEPHPSSEPEPVVVEAAPEPVAPTPLPTRTGAGLAKRTPRATGGRAIPGAETERNVGATRRSPEQIRAMLASHSAGRQRARTEPVPAGAPDERQP